MNKISVVIVNYNGKHHLEHCLRSFSGQWPFEVIVVDNASTDDSVHWLKNRYPNAKVVASDKNLGFAGGNNLGMAEVEGDFVFFLNNDTELRRRFFKDLEPRLKTAGGRVGMFSLRVLYWKSNRVDTLGLRIGRLGVAADIKDVKELRKLAGPSGVGAIYRRETLDTIKDVHGYFDERFFMYSEDVDLAWRARRAGWECQYLPIELFHRHGGSTEAEGSLRDPFLYFSTRNRVLTFKKNNKRAWMKGPFLLVQVVIVLKYVFKGKGGLALRAVNDGYHQRIVAPEKIISVYS